MKIRINDPSQEGRLDRFIRRQLPQISQGLIEKFLRDKQICLIQEDEKHLRVKSNYRLTINDLLFISDKVNNNFSSQAPIIEYDRNLEVLAGKLQGRAIYEDEYLLVLNKPANLASQGGSKVKYSIDQIAKFIDPEYRIVHRLDKETTGVLIIAKSAYVAAQISRKFKERTVDKRYIALTLGKPAKPEGRLSNFISKTGLDKQIVTVNANGDLAETDYKLLDYWPRHNIALMELKPITGRTHQIRVQLAAINCPIIGDKKYGKVIEIPEDVLIPSGKKRGEMMLHCKSIGLEDMLGKKYSFSA